MSPPTKALEVELWKPGTLAATAKTVPEYFRSRYGKASGVIAALIRPIPLIGLTEGQFVASAAILSAGAIFTNDIYRAVLKPDASSKEVMRGTQITMVASGAIAAVIPGSAMVIYLERVSDGDLFDVHLSQPISPGLVGG